MCERGRECVCLLCVVYVCVCAMCVCGHTPEPPIPWCGNLFPDGVCVCVCVCVCVLCVPGVCVACMRGVCVCYGFVGLHLSRPSLGVQTSSLTVSERETEKKKDRRGGRERGRERMYVCMYVCGRTPEPPIPWYGNLFPDGEGGLGSGSQLIVGEGEVGCACVVCMCGGWRQ